MSIDRDRRRLFKGLLAAAALPLARAPLRAAAAEGAPVPPAPSRAAPLVFRARREGLGGRDLDVKTLSAALGACVAGAADAESPVAGMRRLFRPTDVVGIKVNCIAGRGLSPHPELVECITGWLQEAGVPAHGILVMDRTDRELSAAGYRINRGGAGVRVYGTERDYDWTPREWGPNASCFARVLVKELTALINVGLVKDHELAGVSIGMKNWYGVIHNPNKCHTDGCHPFVAHLAAYPLIRDKLRLTIVDGLTAQCHAGPSRSPRWAWNYGGVMVGTDPVAIDAVGLSIIEARRKEVGLPSLAEEKRQPRWLPEAERLGLGEADMSRIKVTEL